MSFAYRHPRLTQKAVGVSLALALLISACSDGDGAVDASPSDVVAADDVRTSPAGETEAVEGDVASEGNESSVPADEDGGDSGASNSAPDSPAADNPAADEIRDLIRAQSSLYQWDSTQVDCIADGVIATGEALPGDLPNEEYASIIRDCGGLRGQLEFAMGIVLDGPTAKCVVDALSDDEVDALGTTVLEGSFEVAETAMDEVLAAHPECS